MDKSPKNQGRNRKRDAEGRYADSNSNAASANKSGQSPSHFNPKDHPRDEEGRFTDK